MSFKILAINPGSTSTKIALYEDAKEISRKSIDHPSDELSKYEKITDQYEMRYQQIMDFLKETNFDVKELAAVVGRGGPLPPVRSGAYKVNQAMMDTYRYNPVIEHASNLGSLIAHEIAESAGVEAYIYDSISVDELDDIARISGLVEIERQSLTHCLNMRAAAIKTAAAIGKNYKDCNFVVAHLGGGISLSAHRKGKMVDMVSDVEGPFSPERAGVLPTDKLVELCYSTEKAVVKKMLRGKGGLMSYLNTNSVLDVVEKINTGDERAKLVLEAMAYQVAKAIGELSVVLEGDIDKIILTGGIAYSEMIIEWIRRRVAFIAPVEILPGENELESLALGALRVLKGEEEAYEFIID